MAGLVDDPHPAVPEHRQDVVSVNLGKPRVGAAPPVIPGHHPVPRAASLRHRAIANTAGWVRGQPRIGRGLVAIEIPSPLIQARGGVARQLSQPLPAGRTVLDMRDERGEPILALSRSSRIRMSVLSPGQTSKVIPP